MRKLAIVLSLLAVFVIACSSGDDGADERQDEAAKQPTATAEAPTSVPEPTATPEVVAEPPADDGGLEALGDLNPLSLISGPMFGGGGQTGMTVSGGQAPPELKVPLLKQEDLPPGYMGMTMGDLSFSVPGEEGQLDMAMSMFFLGDEALWSGESADASFDSMVMSAVMTGFGEAMDESFAQLEQYTDDLALEHDIQEALGQGEMFGVSFDDVRLLDVSGLGDGGMGLHMVMTMDLEQFGGVAMAGEDPFAEGMAMDMFMFARGDHMLMLMVLWPGYGPPPLDGKSLAEVMDSRAETVF